jgi:RND superfamily putative drug exporter
MVVVDRTDVVVDRPAREALADALARAQGAGVAVVLGAAGVSATDLVPLGTPVLDVGAGWGAPATLGGGDVPPPVPGEHVPPAEPPAPQPPAPQPTHDQQDATIQEVRA